MLVADMIAILMLQWYQRRKGDRDGLECRESSVQLEISMGQNMLRAINGRKWKNLLRNPFFSQGGRP